MTRLASVPWTLLLAGLAVPMGAYTQEFARQRLEKSPRHQEWVEVKRGDRTIHCFVVYPEKKEKTPAVLVIHENRGLTDWVRLVCDELAEAGYIGIAPDLLSGHAPGGGKTSDFKSADLAMKALYKLDPDEILADLHATADYAKKLPACNGKIAVCGFCWGGGQCFRFACTRPDLSAAFVFYGAFPHTREQLSRLNCPVYGFYAERDARINATLDDTKRLMKELGKKFEAEIYPGAGHGFMRQGDDPKGPEADRKAREDAWKRWKALLAAM
ncbi:MAG: dienelactone hydrolase family protein [Gemmatales bacterium]|nr:dienelactone hydrolase family protein [Gemmatales bacterium]MDW7994123.1 dienelactone hydrolase family protein [Gemmatales bacterium]